MCWSWQVSVLTWAYGFIIEYFFYKRFRKGAYFLSWNALLAMQGIEAALWIAVDAEGAPPLDAATGEPAAACGPLNRWTMFFGYVLLAVQPWFSLNTLSSLGDRRRNRERFAVFKTYCAFNAAVMIAGGLWGMLRADPAAAAGGGDDDTASRESLRPFQQVAAGLAFRAARPAEDLFAGSQTCAWPGAHGHLNWSVARPGNFAFFPSFYVYLSTMVFPMFFFEPRLEGVCNGLAFLASFVAGWWAAGWGNGGGSFWCWSIVGFATKDLAVLLLDLDLRLGLHLLLFARGQPQRRRRHPRQLSRRRFVRHDAVPGS